MVMLIRENEELAFPPGRYELLLGGQSYDFVIAGTITDPAHCVEGVATARGPAFYECRGPISRPAPTAARRSTGRRAP